jgi:prepilin-type N-terminal cleavage/methylation domain-containing protein
MRKTQHGFTLMELMVTLTVVAILVGVATPTFRQFSGNSRTVATTNSLVNALAVARSEALHRSTPVSVCASTDMQTCNATADWTNQGWIVFTDPANAGVVDPGELVLQTWPPPGGTAVVRLTYANTWLQYNARGMTSLAGQAIFTTYIPGCRGNNQSQIVVTVMGSPQTTKIACP